MKFLKCIFYSFFIFNFFFFNAQEKNYLDHIFSLENKISSQQFVDTILKIPFDKAMLNPKKYLTLTEKAAIIVEKKDSLSLAKIYEAKSLAYHFTSKTELAILNTIKASEIYNNLNNKEKYADCYINLGWQLKNRDLEKAKYYINKGLKVLKNDTPKSYLLEKAYNHYGVLKQRQQQLDSALYFHKKALQISSLIKDSLAIPFAQTYIAEVLIKQDKFSEAESLLEKALEIRKIRNDKYGVTDSFLYLGDLFYKKKAYNKAIDFYKNALEIANENGYFPLKKYATEYLYKSYNALNNYEKALTYFTKFNELKDSILNKQTNSKIAELQIEFETLQKEKTIAEQQLIIKNRNQYAIIITSILIILGIIFFAIYKRNQLKRKQLQKEIDLKDTLSKIKTQNRLQEQRLKISRDLHDNIGSQLTFIISSLDNLKYVSKESNQKLKDKLTYISSFTGDTIHQLRDTIWAMNKSEITLEDLHTRILSFVEKVKLAVPNLEFDISTDIDKEKSFTSLAGMNIFRVIQEAINNAIKYAEAKKINIQLTKEDTNFKAIITDDGIGFNINEVEMGNGLSNMEKRMSEIKGKVKIQSKQKVGTKIILEVPIKK